LNQRLKDLSDIVAQIRLLKQKTALRVAHVSFQDLIPTESDSVSQWLNQYMSKDEQLTQQEWAIESQNAQKIGNSFYIQVNLSEVDCHSH
jgi:hypothetical protein